MRDNTYSSVDIKLAVMEMPILSQRLIGVGKPYEKLLLAILEIDRESNERLPTDKKMIQELAIKPHFFRKRLRQIYDDLYELLSDENKAQMIIGEVEHHISYHRDGKGFYFVTRLPVTPRLGDSLNLDFFRPIDGNGYYYVSRIYHRITESKQVIDIILGSGFHNSYSVFRDDKEEMEAHDKGYYYWDQLMKKRRNE